MFRLPPSRITIEDINPSNLSNQFDPATAISPSQAANAPNQTPLISRQRAGAEHQPSISTAPAPALLPPTDPDPINNYTGSASDLDLPPPSQLPYEHLPYGPEREAIIHQNYHISHVEHMSRQLNAQSAIVHSVIAQMGASHQHTLDRLTAEISFYYLQNKIHHWRERVMIEHEADYHLEGGGNGRNQGVDLMEKFADLRAGPISGLAGVKAAESASDAGVETDLEPPIATVPGIKGIPGAVGDNDDDADAMVAGSGRLYGAAEDLAVFLAGDEAGESDVAEGDASSATMTPRLRGTPALEGAGVVRSGPFANFGRAVTAVDVDVAVDPDVGPELGTDGASTDEGVMRGDAHRAPATKPPRCQHRRRCRRRRLLDRLIRTIF